jgi:hypothetical protein
VLHSRYFSTSFGSQHEQTSSGGIDTAVELNLEEESHCWLRGPQSILLCSLPIAHSPQAEEVQIDLALAEVDLALAEYETTSPSFFVATAECATPDITSTKQQFIVDLATSVPDVEFVAAPRSPKKAANEMAVQAAVAAKQKGDWVDCTPAGGQDAANTTGGRFVVEQLYQCAPGPCDMGVDLVVVSPRPQPSEKPPSPDKRAPPKSCFAADVKSGHVIRGRRSIKFINLTLPVFSWLEKYNDFLTTFGAVAHVEGFNIKPALIGHGRELQLTATSQIVFQPLFAGMTVEAANNATRGKFTPIYCPGLVAMCYLVSCFSDARRLGSVPWVRSATLTGRIVVTASIATSTSSPLGDPDAACSSRDSGWTASCRLTLVTS